MLKRGRYVHCVHDATTGKHIVVDLNTKRRLHIDGARFPVFERVLAAPNNIDSFTPEELAVRQLLEHMTFLVPYDLDELADLEQRYWDEKRCPQNLALGIVLTQKCNFRCIYCNQEHFGKSISSTDAARIRSFLQREAPALQQFYVTWWGGEPLLKLDILESLSRQFIDICDARAINYRAFTSTNASLITREVASRLTHLRFAQFQISIDGPRQFHDAQRPQTNNLGSYDTVLRGLKNLVGAFSIDAPFITLRVHTTALVQSDRSSWSEFFDDLEVCKPFIRLHFIPAHESFRFTTSKTITAEEMNERLAEVLEEARTRGYLLAESALLKRNTLMHCGAVSDRSWFVLPGSRLTRCNNAFNDPKDDCGLIDDWGRIRLFPKAREWIDHSPFKLPECVSCDVLPICMGGCRIVDFTHISGARCQIKQTVRSGILEAARDYQASVVD